MNGITAPGPEVTLTDIEQQIRAELAGRALYRQYPSPQSGDRELELGQLLAAAQQRVGKGNWLEWLAGFGINPRTAQRHIRAAVLQDSSVRRTISAALRWMVWERDDFRCHYCGVRQFLETDHKIPREHGGTDDLSNIVTACKTCNTRKGLRSYAEFVRMIGGLPR